MTNLKIVEPKNSLRKLRDGLEQAERQILQLDRTNVEAFLLQLDQIEQMFADFGTNQTHILGEVGRWADLLSRITSQPKVLVDAASSVGGLSKLRSKHQPAAGRWWQMEIEMKRRRTQALRGIGMTVGAIAVMVGLLFFAINYFAAPSQPARSLATTTAKIEQLVTDQKWQAALTLAQTARQSLPNEAELLVWEAVLSEQLGDAARAQSSLALAQQQFISQPAAFWMLVGNDRQLVGNLDGAEQAAQQALSSAPEDAQITFLLASVAEARGDTVQAADYFNKTIALAGDSNVELGVIAKMRMGTLMQQVQPVPAPAQTIAATATPS